MKKILIIQYFFKPITSNQSFRYERILENIDEDVQVDVLTSLHYGLEEEEQYKNINVYRVNNKFLKKRVNLNSGKFNNNNTSNSSIKRLINSFIKKIMWPDFAFLWVIPTYLKGKKLLNNNNYDMVYTVSFPFSAHLVGYFLKFYKKDIKWTVDYIDPFSIIEANENPSNNVKLYNKLNRYVEKNINLQADRIFILEEACERFVNSFPVVKDKITIIPPMIGIDTKKYDKILPYQYKNVGINIVYTGTLYKSIRNPEGFLKIFLELLKQNPNIFLHIIGDSGDCTDIIKEYQKIRPNNIFIYGKVSRESTIAYLKGADILLNIDNSSYSQLPGKVVEYLYVGKKIINFSKKEKGTSSFFFLKNAQPKQVIEISEDNYNINDILEYFYESIIIDNINTEIFSPKSIAEIYFSRNI